MPMTEAEWLTCTNSSRMLEFLREKLSARKLRLFVGACCRSSWHLLADKRSRQAVAICERFADGVASKKNLETALANAKAAARIVRLRLQETARRPGVSQEAEGFQMAWATNEAVWAAQKAVEGDAWRSALQLAGTWATSERTGRYSFMREIIGNPFRPISINPSWLTSTISNLAATAYEDRALPSGHLDFTRLAVLADALEVAGCTNADILTHCRHPGPHVRGCWVVDLILGKE
jgi:hypothetical protein